MISVSAAQDIVRRSCPKPRTIRLSLDGARGAVAAETLFASLNVPPFFQSAMDGYAFSFEGYQKHRRLRIEGLAAAGDRSDFDIAEDQAVRIFTGAALPRGADTVIEQESVLLENGYLSIQRQGFGAGLNVRPPGSDIVEGAVAIERGALLTPAAWSFLASLGFPDVPVWAPPAVAVIVTGNELIAPGRPIPPGGIYESNSTALRAALHASGVETITVLYAPDDLDLIGDSLRSALETHDIVLLTGGVSAGDFDYVPAAAERNNVETLFHKVRQKPGKPIFFGIKNDRMVFGLPGNPASVLTCYYAYVAPAVAQIRGLQPASPVFGTLKSGYRKNAGMTHFLKARLDGQLIEILDGQASYQMRSFAAAHCLAVMEEDQTDFAAGDRVELMLFL